MSPVLSAIEERFAPFRARPHWGKVFNTTPEVLDGLHPKLRLFRDLVRKFDPTGKFGNELVGRLLMDRNRLTTHMTGLHLARVILP